MAGVLPVVFAFGKKPQGHGYTELETVANNPFFAVGEFVRGHEFHYTFVQEYTNTKRQPLEQAPAHVESAPFRSHGANSGSTCLAQAEGIHESSVGPGRSSALGFAFRVHRGFGFDGQRDGLCWRNVLANYTHVHALGVQRWAASVVGQALNFRSRP
jgi:cobyrinic acid a,c-diamide synthase